MSIPHILLFALVEGLTEFLPVSSTGHLILTAELLRLPTTDMLKSFEIAIQSGAILAVVVLYGRTLLRDTRTLLLVGAAFVPTAIIGFLLHSVVKQVFLGNTPLVLWSLFLGGIILLFFERFLPSGFSGRRAFRLAKGEAEASPTDIRDGIRRMSFLHAFLIGLCQSVAIIPGVSRSAATVIGGQFLGMSRAAIVEFSFLLAIPTMAAATGYDLLRSAGEFTSADMQAIALGFVLSFFVALAAIRWFIGYIKHHSFAVFGVYRIALAAVFWLFLMR